MFIFLKRPPTSPTPSSVVVSQLPPRRRQPTSSPRPPPPPPPTSPKAAHPFPTTLGTSQQTSRPRRPRPTIAVSRPRYIGAHIDGYPKWANRKCSQLLHGFRKGKKILYGGPRGRDSDLYYSTLKSNLHIASVMMFSLQDSPSQNVATEDYTDTSLSADVAVAEWVQAGGGQVQGGRHRHGGGRRAALRGSPAASEAARGRQS